MTTGIQQQTVEEEGKIELLSPDLSEGETSMRALAPKLTFALILALLLALLLAALSLAQNDLAYIIINPSEANMQVGETRTFTAEGRDQDGNPIPIPDPQWTVNGGGTISSNGNTCTFTATETGDYQISCYDSGSTKDGSASLHISPSSQLHSIELTPAHVDMQAGQEQTFTAEGKDENGNPVPIPPPQWAVNGGGTISSNGSTCTVTAGDLPGRYAVRAIVGSVTGRAEMKVLGPPPCPNLTAGESCSHTFAYSGIYPYYDRFSPSYTGTVVVSPTLTAALDTLNATIVVSITATGFEPPTVTIAISDTVRWTNADTTTHAINGGEPYWVYLPLVQRAP
jgi:plastocyanin